MITPFVMRAFDRLAEAALMDIARSAPAVPDDTHTNRFMEEVLRLDRDMRSAYEKAKSDDVSARSSDEEFVQEDMFRDAFEQILESITHGSSESAQAVSDGDVTRLVGQIRLMLQKTMAGQDRKRKSIGLRARLYSFGEGLSESKTHESTAREIAEFVQKTFSGEVERLTRKYWWSKSRRGGNPKGALLTQEHGEKKAWEEADAQVFKMLLEGVRRTIETEKYAEKASDAHALGAIVEGVWWRIKNRETGDQYDSEVGALSGEKGVREKWRQYIAPLRDTGEFGDSVSLDTIGITEFLNEHFLRKDLRSGTPVEAPLPGGATMTAPSFKTERKHSTVRSWVTGGLPGVSTDAPIGEEGGGTIGDTISAPKEDTEGPFVEWLESPAEKDPSKINRDLVREDIRGWVDEAMRRVSVTPINEDAVKDILLVKMGLVSSEAEKNGFLEKWLGDGTLAPNTSWPRFRAEPIDKEVWKELGEPFKKGWMMGWKKTDGPAPTESPYSKEWKQQALVNKTTGEQFVGRLDALKKENQDNLEVVTKVHKKGDEPKKQHMLNWTNYNREDRETDLNRALDMYGEQWFEQSVNKDVREELKKSDETLAEAFRKFRPESIFTAVAKGADTELIRAMGYVKPSISLETGKTPFKKHPEIYPDIKKAIGKLGEIMVEESEKDDSALRYLSYKRIGRVAMRMNIESIVSITVDDLVGTQ